MEPLLNTLVRLRIPTVAVLGNHDYESEQQAELMRMMTAEGVKVLDGSAYERDGVGFAGTKGFVGGFGRGVLTAFGEPEIKTFVRASIDEALKLERAMSQLRTTKRVVVLHYAPIAATTVGEAPEISPFLGTSRLAEVIDRHGADLVLHGHAHNGTLNGHTTGGIPVHNVAITLLQSQQPPAAYRVFEI
jgi:Icc-related predicted phosphoesterase